MARPMVAAPIRSESTPSVGRQLDRGKGSGRREQGDGRAGGNIHLGWRQRLWPDRWWLHRSDLNPPPASAGSWTAARGQGAVNRAMGALGATYIWAGGNAYGPTDGGCTDPI